MELIKKQKEYFTEKQINGLKKQYDKLNNLEVDKFAENWNELNSLLQAEMDKGTSVDNLAVIELARKWKKRNRFFHWRRCRNYQLS
jgi:hypothetical protein